MESDAERGVGSSGYGGEELSLPLTIAKLNRGMDSIVAKAGPLPTLKNVAGITAVAGDDLCFSMSDEKFLFGSMGQPNLHVAANGSRPSPWSLPFEEVSSGLTGGEVLLWSSALKRSVGAASVLLWSASGGPVSGPSRACDCLLYTSPSPRD